MCHRRTTWAGVRSWRAATAVIAGSARRSLPLPIGLHDSVTMPRSAWKARDRLARHPRVELDLVDVRGHAGGVDDPLGVLGLEVGQAHGAHQPGLHQVDQALEGVDVAVPPRVGPVDQEQVDPVDPEPLGAHLEGVTGLAPAVPFGVELGGHEQLVPGHAARAHPAAHASLVSVGVGGVDEPVAEPDRLGHDPLGLAISHGPRPQPEMGHPGSVRQLERRSEGRHGSSVS